MTIFKRLIIVSFLLIGLMSTQAFSQPSGNDFGSGGGSYNGGGYNDLAPAQAGPISMNASPPIAAIIGGLVAGIIFLGLLVVYYVLLIRGILEVLKAKANQILLIFMFISLISSPITIMVGIGCMIVWHYYKAESHNS